VEQSCMVENEERKNRGRDNRRGKIENVKRQEQVVDRKWD